MRDSSGKYNYLYHVKWIFFKIKLQIAQCILDLKLEYLYRERSPRRKEKDSRHFLSAFVVQEDHSKKQQHFPAIDNSTTNHGNRPYRRKGDRFFRTCGKKNERA